VIKFDIDIRGLEAKTLLESKRLAYSTATAINRTMLEIQREERAELDRRFTIRKNDFMYRLIKIFTFAKVFKGIGPQQVYGEIGIDHKDRTLLDQFVEGGFKEPVKGQSVGVPVTGSAARPSFSDPVVAALQLSKIHMHPRVLKDGTTQLVSDQDGGIFSLPDVRHGTKPRGLFQKTGDVIRAMYLFVQHPALNRRYDFLGIAERVYDEEFEKQFDRAYKSR
jgi:hypothetical protein